ncbi:MAG: hypothetical protein OEX11_07155 [Nitrosomonas sp.]|nr:hypothetical protein [Nitrosomonas sp.]
MTDENKQKRKAQTLQSKADTLFTMLSNKFEPLAKLPTMQLPAWYGLVFLGLIVVMFAWKAIAVGKVESDMAKKLEREKVLITQQAREYADEQYNKEEERFGQVLSWAIRGELIRNNLDTIDQYLSEIVKMRDTEKVVLIGEDGQLLVSTDKRLEDAEGVDIYPSEILDLRKITIKSDVDGKKILVVPVMGLNNRVATVIVSYNRANLD